MLIAIDETTSIVNHFLYELRHKDIQKDRAKFRYNLKRLGQIMAYEVSKKLNYQEVNFSTPLEQTSTKLIQSQPVLVSILRASMPFFDGFLDYFSEADSAFIGEYRKEGKDISVQLDYIATPKIKDRTLIIIDPMLATGKSIIEAYNQLIKYGRPSSVHFVSVVAAPEGIDYIGTHFKTEYTLWTASVDKGLNEKSYIVPGLGDAGDLCYGEKL